MKYAIISQDNCGYCEKAKALIEADGSEYVEFNLKDHPDLKEFMGVCGLKMVPQIYDSYGYLGGYDDLTYIMELRK